MSKGHAGDTERQALCRSYRFGHVAVDVFPEVVTIAVPYGANHDDFCDASVFIERYTHGADAVSFEDDQLETEIHIYPNTESLVGQPPYTLPPIDPRLGFWDEVTRRPTEVITLPSDSKPPMLFRIYAATVWTEQYIQEVVGRAGIAGIALARVALVHH